MQKKKNTRTVAYSLDYRSEDETELKIRREESLLVPLERRISVFQGIPNLTPKNTVKPEDAFESMAFAFS
jgi:hypothetical protein